MKNKAIIISIFLLIILLALFLGSRSVNAPDTLPSSPELPDADVIYECPETPWIDCMPGLGTAKPECAAEYLQWAEQNCENFEGVAY
ncbi:MAG TPA: hypothetical protein VJG85_01055 [Patescibacteria group bacterium]|nr:hypothetical protein [Patescibacteria group bacterium]